MNVAVILCGTGGGIKDQLQGHNVPTVELGLHSSQSCVIGDVYGEIASDIHISVPEDATVTLVERTILKDPDHALVYWKKGEQWVSAEPRKATSYEVARVTENTLVNWFNEG